MKRKITFTLGLMLTMIVLVNFSLKRFQEIPKVWDEEKLHSAHLPLVDTSVTVKFVPEDYYNKMPVRVAYKLYPMYMPGREPKDYFEWLSKQEPQIIFDPASLRTEADWIKAGEIIYEMPQNLLRIDSSMFKMLPVLGESWKQIGVPVSKEGVIPFLSIVVREKGRIELGNFSCGMCHSKLMPDGKILKGAQGNYPFDKDLHIVFTPDFAAFISSGTDLKKMPGHLKAQKDFLFKLLFVAPWIKHESQERLKNLDIETTINEFYATPAGVIHRHGSGMGYPTAIPDLFHLKERKYFDHTGAIQQRDIGDLMRYATLNQQADFLNDYGGFTPLIRVKYADKGIVTRFTDEQLYALAKFLYSLKPLKNPITYPRSLLTRGELLFKEQGCVTCHPPPHYSNNKLTPVNGFEPPKAHFKKYDIFNISVETDPGLALYTRRGTGYYKVPSLAGVWNRSVLMHDGSLTNIEDLFDPKRLEGNYMPTGYKPAWKTTSAVPGHPFGMELNEGDKKALIAFLKSL